MWPQAGLPFLAFVRSFPPGGPAGKVGRGWGSWGSVLPSSNPRIYSKTPCPWKSGFPHFRSHLKPGP